MSKSSNLNLYSSDNLSERALHIVSVDAKLSMTSPNVFELNAPTFSLAGQTTSANDISDLGQKIADMVSLQASESASHSTSIASNLSSISTLDAREASNHSAQASLLGAETSRATQSEVANATAISAEQTARINGDATVSALVSSEASARATAVSSEETARIAGDAGLQAQITALGVTDATTLASINSMLASYESADNTISGLITALTTRVATLEAQIATLLN